VILARAPLRISLGGGGTDLPSYYSKHGGFILSGAIDKYLYISVNRPAADNLIRIKYSQYEQVSCPDEVQHDLVRPTLKCLNVTGSLEIVSMADVPAGTGLGSSGSYIVALLTALYALKRETVPTQALAEQACDIEMNMAKHPVGKHDHYLAAFGGITTLEIEMDGRVHVSPLNLSISTMEDFSTNVLLFYTGITRSSTAILEEQKRCSENGDGAMVEALHRTKELGYQIKEALEQGELERFGQLLHEHWLNKKRRSNRVSDDRIDEWYRIAQENGAQGGKIMGAGGGGFFMFYCPNSHKPGLRKALTEAGLHEMRYNFDFEGAKVLVNF
jgi:D-glycero-alpha-D-manno-heptose-7-phosphate kinase